MAIDPKHWLLPGDLAQRPFTEGNSVDAFIDGQAYFRDLKTTLSQCDRALHIAGWRVSSGQILDPAIVDGAVVGTTWLDAVKQVRGRGADVKALLFNVPGTDAPGPFRMWHALDNREFCDELIKIGGDAVLDSRLSRVPASSHHQKFVVSLASDPTASAAFLGGIDVCYDRWDHPAHDGAAERQRDFVRTGGIETHQPSQPGWHDVQVKIRGPAIAQIWSVFRDRWNDPRRPNHDLFLAAYWGRTRVAADVPPTVEAGTLAVQINLTLPEGAFPDASGAGEQTVASAHAHAIDRAEHFIYIEDQYVWPCSLVQPLERALARGVRIVMVVARDYDAPGLAVIARRLRRQVIDRLERAGQGRFRVFHLERPDGAQIYVHSKLLVIDDKFVSVGSANFNARSLINDTEIQAGIVDTDTIDIPIGGKPEQVGRFVHEFRCRLWAEHLEMKADDLQDPLTAIDRYWAQAPVPPSRRAVPHVVKEGPINLDALAEYLTTLIVSRIAHVPLVDLPAGVTERSAVKFLVDAQLRGPLAAVLFKFAEEMLNPDLTPTVAASMRKVSHLGHASRAQLQAAGAASNRTPSAEHRNEALSIIERLRKGRMPKMVDWIDPLLLGAVAVRTLISSTIGQYADQRPMQAAMDDASVDEQIARHDYSRLPSEPDALGNSSHQSIRLDEDGRAWLDFIADLGDGFEATYAMAYLMAASHLDVKNGDKQITLPAGEVLVFGGDLAYPNATIKEYQDRCITPYDMAFRTAIPTRQLFYIAGNHDWYDGLTAFTSVFCTARDRYTHGLGKQIGGWRCHQRRSYFALKMPHDWWLWGIDLGLTDTIDDAQLDYFHTMSEATKPGDKVIIITHAPAWINTQIDGLREMTMLARARGAEVPAVLAGDLHHYSRYYSQEAGVNLITSGGGGAFTHATHQLPRKLNIDWAMKTDLPTRTGQATDSIEFNRQEREAVGDDGRVDFSEKTISAVSDRALPERGDRPAGIAHSIKSLEFHSPNFYPEQWRSRLLVLRNIWLPLHNRRFAVMLGLVYVLFGWFFQLSVADPVEQMRKAQYADVEIECLARLQVGAAPEQLSACYKDAYKSVDAIINNLKLNLRKDDSAGTAAQIEALKGETKVEQLQHAKLLIIKQLQTAWQALLLSVSPKRVAIGMLNYPAFFILVLGLWLGLMHYVDAAWKNRFVNAVARVTLGSLHFLAHMALLLIITTIFNAIVLAPLVDARNGLWTIIGGVAGYTALILVFGGLLGGMVWGAYWAMTSALFGMHMDAFSALGIANYKNFLRMSFEADRLTIYPIGVQKIPGRKGWRAPEPGEHLPSHNPLILPKRPLAPILIEEPIVIQAGRGPNSGNRKPT